MVKYGQSLLQLYDYDDATVECSKQQREPNVLVAKFDSLSKLMTRNRAIVVSATTRLC